MQPFQLNPAIMILERTPGVLRSMLSGLPATWTECRERESWTPFEIVGHLIHVEETDWIPRAEIILSDREDKHFSPFDRIAEIKADHRKSLEELLDTFEKIRVRNLEILRGWELESAQLSATGVHPQLGMVTLEQLLATWVAHDLNHIAQIARIMARQYSEACGPWAAYLPILHR